MQINKQIGRIGSAVTGLSVALFAVFMLLPFNFGSFFVRIFLPLGFVLMTGAFAQEREPGARAAANAARMFYGGAEGGDWAGVMAPEFWRAYFLPICVLSYLHFRERE